MSSALGKLKRHNPFPEPDVTGKIMVIYNRLDTLGGALSMRQGLFSEFFSVLGALYYAELHQAAGVYVKFHTDMYLDPDRGDNWWAYFFEPEMTLEKAEKAPLKIHYNKWFYRFGPWAWNQSWSSVVLSNYPQDRPYPMDAQKETQNVCRLVSEYIRVQQPILKKVEIFRQLHMAGTFVIGIHYRGTDKKLLYPFMSPSYELFEKHIRRVVAHYKPDSFKVFVATDEIEFLQWTRERFPGQVICYETSPRMSASDPAATRGGTHKSTSFSGYMKGESAVIDCLLLSDCNYLIKNRSSLSDISMAFNPSLDWAMILGEDDKPYTSAPLPG